MDTKELDLLLYKLKIEFSKNSNQALIETETYSQIIDLFTKQAGQLVVQKIAEVDIENHPLLGDTFIEYGRQSPLLQWKRIAEMLKECDLIVIEKPSNFSA